MFYIFYYALNLSLARRVIRSAQIYRKTRVLPIVLEHFREYQTCSECEHV